MSTLYKGKLYFTKQDLQTKYDFISFSTSLESDYNVFHKKYCEFTHKKIQDKILSKSNLNQKQNKKTDLNFENNNISSIPTTEEWMKLINYDFAEDINFAETDQISKRREIQCIECIKQTKNIPSLDLNVETFKKELLSLIFQSMIYGLQNFFLYESICSNISKYDPEFILKVSLYCRKELNIRSVSNFLLALSAHLNDSKMYLKKYFNIIVNLPTDWMEIVYYYMQISNSTNISNQLRKALVSKFSEFNLYQIGKYQNKSMAVKIESKNINITIKNLIRILHIATPILHVMSLLGKKYPMTNEEFILSKLPDQWEKDRAGKRMKVPIPETWETQISIHGNKPAVWERLIDNKSLPYLATIRNLRNILQSNLKDSYHTKVSQYISKESNVISGKLLPFQYFTAFKILEEYNENILKANQKLHENCKAMKRRKVDLKLKMQKRIRLQKITSRTIISERIVKIYTDSLNKAVAISTKCNIPPIKGKVCIIADLKENTIHSTFKHGSAKSIREVIALLTSMCYFASENVEIYLVNNSKVTKYQHDPKHTSILEMSTDILALKEDGKLTPDVLIENMIVKQVLFDLILTFDVNLPIAVLENYVKHVNSSVLIFINSLKRNGEDMAKYETTNIFTLFGFSEHSLKIISEESNGNIIKKINLIDEKYCLDPIYESIFSKPLLVSDRMLYSNNSQREINIFISSTFLDMEKERSFINKLVIPAVKRNLNLNFVDINCIDLRWGVPAHWGCSDKLLMYCIEQVKRCHIFVGILGSRYGWIPDSNTIKSVAIIYPELLKLEGLSITNIEYKFTSLNCHKVFLIKSDELLDTNDNPELKLFHNEIIEKECFYNYLREKLPNDFNILINHLNTIISDNILPKNTFDSSLCTIHTHQVRSKMIFLETEKLLQYFNENNDDFHKHEVEEIISNLKNKYAFNNRFTECISVNKGLHNKNKINTRKSNYFDSKTSGTLLVIEGEPGSGKTSIMASLIKSLTSSNIRKGCKQFCFPWIFDAIKSININNSKHLYLFDLLCDIIEYLFTTFEYNVVSRLKRELEIFDCIPNEDFWRPKDMKGALLIWNSLLDVLNSIKEIEITILIDGIEQLQDSHEASTLNWIPLLLPSRFCIILTAISDSKLIISSKLRQDIVFHKVLPIPGLYKKNVIENMLRKHGKSLASVPFNNYFREFSLKRDSDKPLFLRMAVNHLLLYTTFDTIKETIKNLPPTLDYLIIHSLTKMEKDLPKEFCIVYFAFISYSKTGFKQEDLQMLMSIYFRVANFKNKYLLTIHDYNKLKEASALPLGFSKYPLLLIKNLSSTILHENSSGRIHFKNLYIKKIVSKFICSINQQIITYIISLYCEKTMLSYHDQIAYRDVIYYKYSSQLFEECSELLTNIKYLKKRFELGMAEDILDDYTGYGVKDCNENDIWLNISNRNNFRDFKNFVAKNLIFLLKNPDLFLQQALNEPMNSLVNKSCNKMKVVSFQFDNTKLVTLKINPVIINEADITPICYSMTNKITFATPGLILNVVAIGYENGLIQIYYLNTFQILFNLRKHLRKVNKMCFFECDNKLISIGDDYTAFIWDSTKGTLISELKAHFRSLTDCIFSIKANVIGTTSLDCQFILWNSGTFKSDHTFKTKSPINCVSKHPRNDCKVIIGCWNGDMIIYELLEYKKVAVLHNTASIKSISFHPHYELFISSDITGHIFLWNSKSGKKLKHPFNIEDKCSSSVTYSLDGLQCIQYANNGSQFMGANIWNTSIGYQSSQIILFDVSCIDSNNCHIACGTKSGIVVIITNDLINKYQKTICNSELTSICFQNSDKSICSYLATIDYNSNLYILQIVEKDMIIKYMIEAIHSKPVITLYFGLNVLISGCEDGSMGIFELDETNCDINAPLISDIFLGGILIIRVMAELILVGSKDKSIGLFDLKIKLLLNHEINAHNDWITALCFGSQDIFISGSNDSSIKIWKIISSPTSIDENKWNTIDFLTKFSLLHVLIDHTCAITSISFQSEELFASSSTDGTIKLWNMNGFFLDNIILEKDYSGKFEKPISIKWIKFQGRHKINLLTLNDKSKLQLLDLNRSCLIYKITDHCEAIISAFDTNNYLFTVSFDGFIRKWSYNDIVKNKFQNIRQFKITHSLFFLSSADYTDLIVAITDVGIVLYITKDLSTNNWKIVDTYDIKAHYSALNLFSTPYLLCNFLKKYDKQEIIIGFSKVLIYFNINSKTVKETNCGNIEIFNDSESQVIDTYKLIYSADGIEIMRNQFQKFILKVKQTAKILELFSLKFDEENPIILGQILLNGYVNHMMVFTNSKKECIIFISYKQGNCDVIECLQFYDISEQ